MKLNDILSGRLHIPVIADNSQLVAFPLYSSRTVAASLYASEMILLVLYKEHAEYMARTISMYTALGFLPVVLLCYLISFAYPQGGTCCGIVSRSFSHPAWSALASISMLVVYIMSLAICASAAVYTMANILPGMVHSIGLWTVLLLLVVMLFNFRGWEAAGNIFSIGGYLFAGIGFIMLILGMVLFVDSAEEITIIETSPDIAVQFKAYIFGFACLSGIMSVPERNELIGHKASPMAVLAISGSAALILFLGFSSLMESFGIVPMQGTTAFSRLAAAMTGKGGFWYISLAAACMILLSACWSCYRDFPRLIAVMAQERIAPGQMKNPGDAMTYTNGIALLTAAAAIPILVFKANIYKMIPFLAVSQFCAFALLLLAVGRKYWAEDNRLFAWLSYCGCGLVTLSGLIFIPVGCSHGTIFALLLMAVFTLCAVKIKEHYDTLGAELRLTAKDIEAPRPYRTTALILTSGMHRGVLPAISYAKSISMDTRALFIATDEEETNDIKAKWETYAMGVPLVIMDSPSRKIVALVLRYVQEARSERPGVMINIIIPEIVFRSTFSKLLHNKVALVLRLILSFQKDVIVTHVSYYPESERGKQ